MKALLTIVLAAALSGTAPAAEKVSESKDAVGSTTSVRDDVVAALRLIVDGDLTQAREKLIAATQTDELIPQARWMLGQVFVEGQWLPYSEAANVEGRWPKLNQYQRQRDEKSDSFRDQLFLADGCQSHGLFDEERAHLMRAIVQNWNFIEGHQRLGHVNVNGFWMSAHQLEQTLLKLEKGRENLSRWEDRITKLHEQMMAAKPGTPRAKQAVQSIADIRTPDAIPAMERYFATAGEREMETYLNWLSRIPSIEASEALASQAVFNPSARLRTLAQHLLRERPAEEYVPTLLGGLTTVHHEYELSIQYLPWIMFTAHRRETVDTQDAILIKNSSIGYVPTDVEGQFRRDRDEGVAVRISAHEQRGSTTLVQLYSRMVAEIARARSNNTWNEINQELRNERVMRVLENATQVQGNQSAEDWWAWWRDINDAPLAKGKLKLEDRYEQTWYVDTRKAVQVDRVTRASCFAPGTLVETEQGQRKIDDVRVGDRVLSQDAETGELQFKPVFDITTRENAKLLKISTASERITCSIGHPFWVVGKGWRMARELEPGAKLYTLDGTLLDVQAIDEAGTGPVFNLVVADFGTYFAGSSRFYTHDVTPRRASDMVIPGLRKEFQ